MKDLILELWFVMGSYRTWSNGPNLRWS